MRTRNMLFTTEDMFKMIHHWLSTPENGYLGLNYGGQKVALQAPEGHLNNGNYELFITKLLTDIPPLVNVQIDNIVKTDSQITFFIGQEHRSYDIV